MEKVIKRQKRTKTEFERTITNYKKDSKTRKTKIYLQNKLEELSQMWGNFEENHRKIEEAEEDEDTEKYLESDIYSIVKDLRLEQKVVLEEALAEINKAKEKELEVQRVQSHEITLPPITIPKFGGDYKEWMPFKDIFTTLIHENERLSKVQKLHYLKLNLYGEAETLLKQYTVTEANYEAAWQILQDRYCNKRILIKTQLKNLFS